MYVVSNKFREKVYGGGAEYKVLLTINGTEVPIRQIAKITINSPIIDNSVDTFYVGSFISQSITIKFKNLDGLDIASNNQVELKIGMLIDDAIEFVPIGKYLIDELAENYYETCEITCLDYAVKFKKNVDYSPCFDSLTNTATVEEILQYICSYCGVTLESYPNVNLNVTVGTYDSTISGKQWVSYIAEIMGCNAKISRTGSLILVPLKQQPSVEINALKSKSWKLKERYQISRVVYYDALRNFTSGEETTIEYGANTNNTLFIRIDNPFVTDATVVSNIYDELNGFVMYSLENENYGDISLDAWDVIQFNLGVDDNNNPISYCAYNDNNIVYEMNIMTSIKPEIPTKQQEITTNVIGGDDETNIKMLRTKLDYINNVVSILVQESTNSVERINQLVLDVLSTQNIFQITGGSNLISNSQFLYEDLESSLWSLENNGSNPYNNMGNGYDATLIGKTTSIAKIQLRDTILTSTESNISNLKKNQIYTLNFSYTQDSLTTTRVQFYEKLTGNMILDRTYNQEKTNITNETIQFIANDTDYIFKVTTSTSQADLTKGFFNIYDLMLNSGDKKNWELASAEIYSTVVKMSQLGLSVVATGSKIITLLTSEGFQVRKYANGQIGVIVTQFDDIGMITGVARTTEVHTGNYVMKEETISGREHHIEFFND